jgi:heme/copper-type cytochrome/quinol oxidase subunit 2
MRDVLTTFDFTIGGRHATAHLDIRSSLPATSHRRLGAVALTLVAPAVALLVTAAVMTLSGQAGFELSKRMAAVLPVAGVIVLALLVLAMVLLAVARLRVNLERHDGAWHGHIRLELTRGELVAAVLGLSLIAIFVGHLLADGYACLNGMRRAC